MTAIETTERGRAARVFLRRALATGVWPNGELVTAEDRRRIENFFEAMGKLRDVLREVGDFADVFDPEEADPS